MNFGGVIWTFAQFTPYVNVLYEETQGSAPFHFASSLVRKKKYFVFFLVSLAAPNPLLLCKSPGFEDSGGLPDVCNLSR